MPIDLPEDKEDNSSKKEPSTEWKNKHKIYLTDYEIIVINNDILEMEKNNENDRIR